MNCNMLIVFSPKRYELNCIYLYLNYVGLYVSSMSIFCYCYELKCSRYIKKCCECMYSQYICQPDNYYILTAIRFAVIYCINPYKILAVYNFHILDKDLVMEYMYLNYNCVLLEYVCMQRYTPIITKNIIFMTVINFELRYESYIYGIIIIMFMAMSQNNNSKPIISTHVTSTHTYLYLAVQPHFVVKNKSFELHFKHIIMHINIRYTSTLYTPTILNSQLNYLLMLVNLMLLSKICYYMYNILPININDSNWLFCYYNLFVKRALSVMTTKLLFKIALSPSSISALTVRLVIIKLHVWLFNLNSRYYVLVLPYGLLDITLNKSLDVMLYLDNKSPMERIISISTNTQLSLLNYRQRYCAIYLYNNEALCIFLEYKLIIVSVRLQMCKEYLNGHQDHFFFSNEKNY